MTIKNDFENTDSPAMTLELSSEGPSRDVERTVSDMDVEETQVLERKPDDTHKSEEDLIMHILSAQFKAFELIKSEGHNMCLVPTPTGLKPLVFPTRPSIQAENQKKKSYRPS